MSRLYVVEPRLTVTGMAADERLRVQAREVEGVAAASWRAPRRGRRRPDGARRARRGAGAGRVRAWVRAVARDLRAHAGASLVVAGDGQPPEVHALAHAMNELLGNVGRTVTYAPSPIFEAGEGSPRPRRVAARDRRGRGRDARRRRGRSRVHGGGGPRARAPPRARCRRPPTSDRATTRRRAPARGSCPEAHFLEAWGDARAFDGTASIAQPLDAAAGRRADGGPGARGDRGRSGRDVARRSSTAYWRTHLEGDVDAAWRRVARARRGARRGLRAGGRARSTGRRSRGCSRRPRRRRRRSRSSSSPTRRCTTAASPTTPGSRSWPTRSPSSPGTTRRSSRRRPRRASPSTRPDVVALDVRGRSVRAPVLVVPGMADDVVGLALGYGQAVARPRRRTAWGPTRTRCATRGRRGSTT